MKNYTKGIKSAFIVLFMGAITLNVNAQSGNALDFSGSNNNYVDIPFNPTWTPSIFSVQMYVNPNAAAMGTTQAIFVNAGDSLGTNIFNGFMLFIINNKWTIIYGIGTTSEYSLTSPSTVNFGQWTNIAGTYDGTTLILYVNGVNVASQAITGITVNNGSDITIGALLNAGNEFIFRGQLDELSMWDKTLTPANVTYNMNHSLIPASQPSLITYYNFNEGIPDGSNPTVTTLLDGTSNHQNGNLLNFNLSGSSSNWVGSTLLLPINLINFSGTKKAGGNLLQWSTASEQNSSYFEIQRGVNGTDFNEIAQVSAAGNSNTTKNYQYLDDQISSSAPIYYYRLKMVDKDGNTKYSTIIFIKSSSSGSVTVYPNPAINQITINLSDNSLINTQAVLSDLNGKVLQRITLNQTSTQVDVSSYAKGIYILKLTNGNSIKIIKE
ncbi:MAG TPA: LamG-like jellyroll fold domain-containing protein [Hanamia sp.]|nr:LamG-like jellyroll fold domain-containing protein [Hanamia sp.]